MGEIINLRRQRKIAQRDAARAKGDENAAKFGRSKAARGADAQRAARMARDLDNHKLDKG